MISLKNTIFCFAWAPYLHCCTVPKMMFATLHGLVVLMTLLTVQHISAHKLDSTNSEQSCMKMLLDNMRDQDDFHLWKLMCKSRSASKGVTIGECKSSMCFVCRFCAC